MGNMHGYVFLDVGNICTTYLNYRYVHTYIYLHTYTAPDSPFQGSLKPCGVQSPEAATLKIIRRTIEQKGFRSYSPR